MIIINIRLMIRDDRLFVFVYVIALTNRSLLIYRFRRFSGFKRVSGFRLGLYFAVFIIMFLFILMMIIAVVAFHQLH